MAKLNPYLTFSGNCRDAMNFYKECLGGEVTFMVVGDSPMANQMPPQYKDQILHSVLKVDDFEIMASDMAPEKVVDGNANHMCLICVSEKEMRTVWDRLTVGGTIQQPISEMLFGLIGNFTDKFGKRWMLECDQ